MVTKTLLVSHHTSRSHAHRWTDSCTTFRYLSENIQPI